MGEVILLADIRQEKGKNAVKRLRKEGYITANLYGKDKDNLDLKIPTSEIERRFGRDITPSTVLHLQVGRDGAGGMHTVVIKEWQKDEFKQEFIHLDFQEISAYDKIKLEVPIQLIGQAVGIGYGGVIQQPLRTVAVETRANNLPHQIDVDISALEVGEQITVANLPKIEGLTYLNEPEEVVVGVVMGTREEAPEAVEEPVGV